MRDVVTVEDVAGAVVSEPQRVCTDDVRSVVEFGKGFAEFGAAVASVVEKAVDALGAVLEDEFGSAGVVGDFDGVRFDFVGELGGEREANKVQNS